MLDQLRTHLARIHDLHRAAAVLEWDQEAFMPDGATEARAHQLSTLYALAHELQTSDALGDVIDAIEAADDPARDDDAADAALLRVARRDYDRARKVPSTLVAALTETSARAKTAWKGAREADDFARFAPHLERLVALNREKADALGYADTPYDALLDEYEPGTTTAAVARVFADLRKALVPIVETLAEAQNPSDDCLHRLFDPEVQWAFGEDVARALGYDFARGRQDRSAHPFTTSFSINDVRITTRVDPHFFNPAFFATLHEAGHALYEQGFATELERTPLADGASLGVHESQSRLYENMVGRSRPFWQHYYPEAQHRFPDALGDVPLDTFYAAINRVEPSLIRVEADEVTYNLHVMLRFELERALIEGTLAVDSLPERWNALMDEYLGVRPSSDADGVLQDVHWAMGAFGYFPTYALGNLMSAQLFRQASDDLGDLDEQLARGAFGPLREWLRTHVHRFGRVLEAPELLRRATDETLQADDWLAYVRTKFGAVYGVTL